MAFTRVVGPGIHTQANIDSHNIHSTGIITAVSFVGSGAALTGIDATAIKDSGGNVKVQAQASGAMYTGIHTFTGNVTIGGTLTYEDVKNIDSVGLITARNGIRIPNNTGKLELGSSQQLDISINSGGDAQINTTGVLNLATTSFRLRRASGSHYLMNADQGGGLYLYHNGRERLRTTATGIRVGTGVTIETNGQATFTGIVTATSFKLANGSDVGTGAGGTWSTYTAGIATSKSVGVNTSNLDDNDLVGVGNSFHGLYISNGMMMMDNTLNGNHYIGTAFNGLMVGPVNINDTLSIDGNYVVV